MAFFKKSLSEKIHTLLLLGIALYAFVYIWLLSPKEFKIFILLIIVILLLTRITIIKKYHKISKKAQAFETITRKEYNFWRKHYSITTYGVHYEDYIRISVALSEKKLDAVLKSNLIKAEKKDWEAKSLLAKLAYAFKYEDEIFIDPTIYKEILGESLAMLYCHSCKKYTHNVIKENYTNLACAICGRERDLFFE
jgi:hypothetical protein